MTSNSNLRIIETTRSEVLSVKVAYIMRAELRVWSTMAIMTTYMAFQ